MREAALGERSILITGCSSGIGHDAAVTLKARGWRVFAACRKAEDCARLKADGFESPRIDYTDPTSIVEGLAEVLEATGGTLDAVFNNGAYGMPARTEDLPREALLEMFETNVFGVHDLTQRVLPVMRAQGWGRIVNNSSTLGFVTIPWRGCYAATKHALEALTHTLRVEMRGTGVDVILIQPGPITTKFRVNSIPHYEKWIDISKTGDPIAYAEGPQKRLYTDSGPDRFELPASAVTAKLIRALEAPNPKARYLVTTPTYIAEVLRRILPLWAIDRIVARV